MTNSIYKEVILSKTGNEICILQNGKTIDSRYNPEQSCLNTIANLNFKSSFFVVLGLSSGIICNLLLQKNPDAKIVVLEINKEDFDFLRQIELNKILEKNQNIIFTTLNNLEKNIFQNYIPAIHGPLQVVEQKPWMEININYLNNINAAINNSIKTISADYSVQAHFGKIWTHNILNNLKIYSTLKSKELKINNSRIALVIAAGPSLDSTIKKIIENRNNFTIFSTDTAYQTLLKHNIIADYLISIDGQYISSNHFYTINKKTTVLLDLSGSYSISKMLLENNINFYFFISGHPLSSLINSYLDFSFPLINNGSGTVTIAALDIAIKAGFKQIQVYGADFSFPNNKSYSKGTYLDALYNVSSSRVNTMETTFDKLMYRTELVTSENNIKTTEILNSYRTSFLNYLENNFIKFTYKDFIYTLTNNNKIESSLIFKNIIFEYKKLISKIIETDQKLLHTALLPFIAYLRKQDNNQMTFQEYCKLALSYFVSYN